jgi:hypothetical protein
MPVDKIAFYGAGWQIHAENLAAHLAGREPGAVEARWEALPSVSEAGSQCQLGRWGRAPAPNGASSIERRGAVRLTCAPPSGERY